MKDYFRLLAHLKPHSKYLIPAMIFMVLFAGMSGFSITMIVPFTKILFSQPGQVSQQALEQQEDSDQDEESLVVLLPKTLKRKFDQAIVGKTHLETLGRFCILVFLIFLIKNLFWYAQSFLIVRVEQGVIMDIRNKLYRHFHLLPLEYFHGQKTGVLISRITNDINLVKGAVANGFAQVLRQGFLMLAYLFLVFWASWKLAFIALLLFPFAMLIIGKFGQKVKKSSAVTQEKMGAMTSVLQETISGIRVVKAFVMEKFEIRKFTDTTRDYFKTMVRLTRVGSLAPPLTEVLGVFAAALLLWFAGREILSGTLDPGRFFLFLFAMLSLMQPIRTISHLNIDIQQGLAAGKRIFEVLDTKPRIKTNPEAVEKDSLEKSVTFDNVCFSYDGNKEVLSNLTFEVKAGEVVALVGPSGAGKSTSMDLLPRFYDPTKGKIKIDGIDLKRIDLGSLRNLMGIVTQETILFNDTVWNNIAYGHERASEQRVHEAGRAANAHDFITAMPQGYQTTIGDRGVKLSGGEKQRLAIARALFKNPPILIFDEATSSLDSESEALVQEAIDRLMKGRTVFVIAHRLSTIQNVDKILVLDHGRIVQTGNHESLMKQGGLYKRLYRMQFKL
ncbi:MAG: ATP-binding cassette domain-containing protein [candidate division Zixibacteria bacterium]|nr:ATP-binding cassette domain-containing protein [candidate division Zixibacteria bacterium]